MHKTMRSLFILFLIASSTFLVGCGSSVPVIKPFKLDIQQGNVVTSKMLLQLRPGMTKSQVRFIMGTPLVVDSFHSNRWDYFYQMRQAGKVIEQRRVILDFEKELLSRVRGDVVPQGTPGADTGAVTLSGESSIPARSAPKEGLLENLKFWKSREPEVVKPVPQTEKTPTQSTIESKPKTETAEPAKEVLPIAAPATVTNEPDTIAEPPASESTATEAEPPSMLAVPIEIGPTQTESTQTDLIQAEPKNDEPVKSELQQSAPVPSEPAIEAPAQSASEVADVPAEMPVSKTEPLNETTPDPAQMNQDERFIFRMDKQLKTESLESVPQVEDTKPAANADKPEVKVEPEEEYGYFERLLEKIGF